MQNNCLVSLTPGCNEVTCSFCIAVQEEDELIKDEYAQEYKALQDQNQGYQHQNLEKKKQKVRVVANKISETETGDLAPKAKVLRCQATTMHCHVSRGGEVKQRSYRS